MNTTFVRSNGDWTASQLGGRDENSYTALASIHGGDNWNDFGGNSTTYTVFGLSIKTSRCGILTE